MNRPWHCALLALLALPALAPCAASQTRNAAPSTASSPRVTADAGVLEGRVDTSGILLFRGIPYAEPPVGDLRWRPPRPAANWEGIRGAERLGHNCMQAQPYGDIDPFAAGISEDCLYLNVWTQSLERRRPRPVMVWIHGGGFFAGFGGEERHNGARLAQKGAVVVTINYRLGVFGFLVHPALAAESPHHVSGNYGLLDQVAALEWVHRNIARFGGDPSRVTIFGESAGSISVAALLASPFAKGLFHRAILESGTTLGLTHAIAGAGPFAGGRDTAEAAGLRVAAAFGVSGGGTDSSAAARLRAVNADTVLATSVRLAGGPRNILHWPVVDGYVFPHPADSAIALGSANVVPVIVGSNGDESQEVFGAPSRAFARLMTSRGARTFLYQFTRVGDDTASRRAGAYHSAEITFVFGRPRPLQASAGRTAYDSTLAEAMSDYWVAFATTGDPNAATSAGRWPFWPSYRRVGEAYLELGPQIVAKRDLRRVLYDSLDAVARAHGEVRP